MKAKDKFNELRDVFLCEKIERLDRRIITNKAGKSIFKFLAMICFCGAGFKIKLDTNMSFLLFSLALICVLFSEKFDTNIEISKVEIRLLEFMRRKK